VRKITSIDTVKGPGSRRECFPDKVGSVPLTRSNISSRTTPNLDHSGSLPKAIEAIKPEKVFASTMGVKNLKAHFHGIGEIARREGGRKMLELGGRHAVLLIADGALAPTACDVPATRTNYFSRRTGFGMHIASNERLRRRVGRGWSSTKAPSISQHSDALIRRISCAFSKRWDKSGLDIE